MTKILRLFRLTAIIAAMAVPVLALAQCGLKNIILFIADGWGYNQIVATDYWHGVSAQVYEGFPVPDACIQALSEVLDVRLDEIIAMVDQRIQQKQ